MHSHLSFGSYAFKPNFIQSPSSVFSGGSRLAERSSCESRHMTSDILKSADEAARIASATVSKSSTYPASNSSFDSQNAHPPRASADARATAAPCQDRIGRAPGAAKTSRSKEAHGAKTRLQPHLQRVAAMAPPPSRHNPAEAARVVASAPARNAPPESQQPRNAHAANSATYAVAPLQVRQAVSDVHFGSFCACALWLSIRLSHSPSPLVLAFVL
eukprot:5267452-Pleurochrysis_carterae.AAC.1